MSLGSSRKSRCIKGTVPQNSNPKSELITGICLGQHTNFLLLTCLFPIMVLWFSLVNGNTIESKKQVSLYIQWNTNLKR